jgi:hypothetical protein
MVGIVTVFCSASNEAALSSMASGPGLTVPIKAVPFQVSSRVTGFRCSGLGPQSPVQVPLSGSAPVSEADSAAGAASGAGSVAGSCAHDERNKSATASKTVDFMKLSSVWLIEPIKPIKRLMLRAC